MRFIIINSLNAISYGSLLFMIASGFSLIFGLMKITNIVHITFFTLGLYFGYVFMTFTGNFLLAILGSGLAISIIGFLIFRLFLRRMRGVQLSQVLLGLGFLFLFDDIVLWIFGGTPLQTPTPAFLSGGIALFDIKFPIYRLFLIGVGAVIMITLDLIVNRTKVGALIRSGVDDEETVKAMGVNIYGLFTSVYIGGTFLAAIGGVMGGPLLGMEPRIGFSLLPIALAIVIVGGMGNLRGAYFASMIIAVIDNFGKALFPEFAYFTIFLPMAIICVLRPEGLFAKRTNKKKFKKAVEKV